MSDPLADQRGHERVKRASTVMIVAGWALAIILLTLLFNGFLARRQNPNPASVVDGQSGSLVLQANPDGMYITSGKINGVPTDFLLDTGATWIAVPLEVAEAANMQLGRREQISTANGYTVGWQSKVDVLTIGPLRVENENAIVLEDLHGPVLLGMNVLRDQEIVQSGGRLELRPER